MNDQHITGNFRAIETAKGTFIVQRAVNGTEVSYTRRWWRLQRTEVKTIRWQTIRDTSRPPVGSPSVRFSPTYPALTFGSLEAAQNFVDALRHDIVTYPIFHPLN